MNTQLTKIEQTFYTPFKSMKALTIFFLVCVFYTQIACGAFNVDDNRKKLDSISDFYHANPQLFAERKIYRLQEISIVVDEEEQQKILNYYEKIDTLNDMKTWLDNNDINYRIGLNILPAEQIPVDLLKTLSTASSGQTFIVELENGISIMQVTGIELSPRNLDDSTQDITSFLEHQNDLLNKVSHR